jgi:hypothetical protein
MRLLDWHHHKVRNLRPAELWLLIAGCALSGLGLGMLAATLFPRLANPASLPLAAIGFLFIGIAFKGYFRKDGAAQPPAPPGVEHASARAAPSGGSRDEEIISAIATAAKLLPDRRREWPPLVPEQIAVWGDALSPYRVSAFHIVISGPNSARLGKSIAAVAEQMTDSPVRIQIELPSDPSLPRTLEKFGGHNGVTFLAPKDYAGAPVLLGLLKSSGYHGRWEPQPGMANEIQMYIGEKP